MTSASRRCLFSEPNLCATDAAQQGDRGSHFEGAGLVWAPLASPWFSKSTNSSDHRFGRRAGCFRNNKSRQRQQEPAENAMRQSLTYSTVNTSMVAVGPVRQPSAIVSNVPPHKCLGPSTANRRVAADYANARPPIFPLDTVVVTTTFGSSDTATCSSLQISFKETYTLRLSSP
jgi:hypothetical protein